MDKIMIAQLVGLHENAKHVVRLRVILVSLLSRSYAWIDNAFGRADTELAQSIENPDRS
jgi:hypothetical protein